MSDVATNRPIRWLPDYAIGVIEIDQQHEGLFCIAEEFRLALRETATREALDRILEKLVAYTHYHFGHEERLMEQIGYPHLHEHRKQHEELRSNVSQLKERAESGDTGRAIEVIDFIIDWLKSHVTTSDRRIGGFMRRFGLVS